MSRRATIVLTGLILAVSQAQGTEFLFDARVDVIMAVTVQVGEFPPGALSEIPFHIDGSQDQCLQWSWDEESPVVATLAGEDWVPPSRPVASPRGPAGSEPVAVLHVDWN